MPRWDTYPETSNPAVTEHLILPDTDERVTIDDLATVMGVAAGVTNLTWTASTGVVASSSGTDATLTIADTNNPGLMSSAMFDKLDGAVGAVHWLQYSIPGTLTTGVGAIPIPIPATSTITAYRVKAGTAPTGATIILDFNIDGTTAFTTQGNRPTIAISGTTSTTTLPDVVAVAAGSYLTIDVDQIGSTVAGANVGIMIELTES